MKPEEKDRINRLGRLKNSEKKTYEGRVALSTICNLVVGASKAIGLSDDEVKTFMASMTEYDDGIKEALPEANLGEGSYDLLTIAQIANRADSIVKVEQRVTAKEKAVGAFLDEQLKRALENNRIRKETKPTRNIIGSGARIGDVQRTSEERPKPRPKRPQIESLDVFPGADWSKPLQTGSTDDDLLAYNSGLRAVAPNPLAAKPEPEPAKRSASNQDRSTGSAMRSKSAKARAAKVARPIREPSNQIVRTRSEGRVVQRLTRNPAPTAQTLRAVNRNAMQRVLMKRTTEAAVGWATANRDDLAAKKARAAKIND